MGDGRIYYKAGYKYQLAKDYLHETSLPYSVRSPFIDLQGGILVIKEGYAWDGPSSPAIDTKNFMRGSLVHDALYQLMGDGLIPQAEKEYADKLLRKICLEDGMSGIRAWWVYNAVRIFGGTPEGVLPNPILTNKD